MTTPNILFITCDQLRKDALGCYGNETVRTANIDRLARQGVRFERVFAALPVCAPNRASMATGRYPSVHGLRTNGTVLPHTELTLMEVLRGAGYATYGTGKMHFGPQWKFPPDGSPLKDPKPELAVNPQPQSREMPWYGFEKVQITEDHRVGPYADYLREHGFDSWADPHSFSYPQHQCVRSVYPEEHHQTTWVADRSIDFLNEHPTDQPFFMWTSFVHPHHPFNPPAPYDTMYNPDDMPLPVWDESEVDGWPERYKCKYMATEGSHEAIGMCDLPDSEWRKIKAYYYGMISLIDKQIGRLVETLRERGLLDNTIILFTSDHGELLGDHHLVFKGVDYDCVTNVPFIVTLPDKQNSGSVRRQIGSSVDIMPTVLEMAGMDVPVSVQGKSLVPVMKDENAKLYDEAFIESVPDTTRTTIWTEQARLTWHGKDKHGELYDHRKDPNCFRNLWDDPSSVELKLQMLGRLIDRRSSNFDPVHQRLGAC